MFTDEVVVLVVVIIVLYAVCRVLLPDEQLNASMLTSMARTKINGKKQRVGFVFTLLSNGRYRRFPLCPRDLPRNPPAATPYLNTQVFSSKSWLIFTIQNIIMFLL